MSVQDKLKGRTPLQTRSIAMRERIIYATLDMIYEMGCQAATTQAVAERAQSSRGALLYHFPTRAELIATAMDRLLEDAIGDIRRTASDVRAGKLDFPGFVDFLWVLFSNRFFYLSLEFVVAARIDASLRVLLVPVIKRFHDALDDIWGEFHTSDHLEGYKADVIFNMTVCLFRGMGVQTVLRQDRKYYADILATWKSILADILQQDRMVRR